MEYKIEKLDYYNKAKLISTRFKVKRKRKILGITVWSYIYEDLGWGESYTSHVSFETVDEAELFVTDLLKGIPVQGEIITEVKTIVSNENFPR